MSWPVRIGTIAQPSGAQYQMWMMGNTAYGILDNNQSSLQLTPKIATLVADKTYVSASASSLCLVNSEDFYYLISSSKQCGQAGSARRRDDSESRRINVPFYNEGTLTGSFKFVAQGYRDATLISLNGKLWFNWNENAAGTNLVLLSSTTDWRKAACGSLDYGTNGQRVCIKNNGTLWAFGQTQNGTIATSSVALSVSPIAQIGTATDWDDVKCCGSYHMIARKTGGTLWAWGRNTSGQLGDNTVVNKSSPIQIGALNTWTKIAAGAYHCAAVRSDGTLWTWGENTVGQLGHNNTTNRSSPVQVGALTTWADVFCGPQNTFAIKTDGTLWSWGQNNWSYESSFAGGMLGVGDMTNRSSPTQVGTDTDWTNAFVAVTRISSRAIKSTGKLWTWGSDSQGGTMQSNFMNLSFNQIPTTNWSSSRLLSCNRQLRQDGGVMALKKDNTLWYWGLWNPTSSETDISSIRISPVQIGTGSNWSTNFDFAASRANTLAIDRNNRLWQLATQNNTQTRVGTGSAWAKVSISADINNQPPQWWALLVTTTGQLWSYGYNNSGQLGNNTTTTNNTAPARVGTLTNWKDVTTGTYESSLAVKTDGTLWAWGNNTYGQLGLGDVVNRSSPVQVGTGTNWTYVSCRFTTTHAIKTDGTLWAWGTNERGQMGNSSTIARSSPVQVGTDTNWKQVESYGPMNLPTRSCTIGLKTNGTIYVWGDSSYIATTPAGTLPYNPYTWIFRTVGNGTANVLSSPVQSGFGWNTWTHVSAGVSGFAAIATR